MNIKMRQIERQKDFTSLHAWKKARAVRLFFYEEVLPKLPNEGKYNLGIQIRKAAVSSTANIAEGYSRYHYKEGIQFYRISRGSQGELRDHLISCLDARFIGEELFTKGDVLLDEAGATLNGFINYIRKSLKRTD